MPGILVKSTWLVPPTQEELTTILIPYITEVKLRGDCNEFMSRDTGDQWVYVREWASQEALDRARAEMTAMGFGPERITAEVIG